MSSERKSFGSRLSKFIIVISGVALVITLYLNPNTKLTPQTAGIFLILVVIAAAIDSVWVKLILAVFGLGWLLLNAVNYDLSQFQIVALSVGTLLLMLFGAFVMFGGMRKR
jgi:hypothetical protein